MITNSDIVLGAVIFILAVACVVGLRLTKPATITRPAWDWDPEPRHVVSVVRPMALAEEPVHVFETPAPVAYTDETMRFPDGMLAFLNSLPDVGPGSK